MLCVLILSLGAYGQDSSGGATVYGKIVQRYTGGDARIPFAVVSFFQSNGAETAVRADGRGEYSIILTLGERYSLNVKAKGFCPSHRPPFVLRPGQKVKFDLLLMAACPRELVTVFPAGSNPSESDYAEAALDFCAKAGVYYCEQQLTMGATTILIGFTFRTFEDGHFLYSFDMRNSSFAQERTANPSTVLVDFDTYTIRAKTVTLDLQKKTLIASGDLSVTHDDQDVSGGSQCMSIRFADKEPMVGSCD